jgi:hypothetical protein
MTFYFQNENEHAILYASSQEQVGVAVENNKMLLVNKMENLFHYYSHLWKCCAKVFLMQLIKQELFS